MSEQYERLTERNDNGYVYLAGVNDDAVFGTLEPEGFNAYCEAMRRLAAYEDSELTAQRVTELAAAERDGRLVVLPCKKNATIYEIVYRKGMRTIVERLARSMSVNLDHGDWYCIETGTSLRVWRSSFGKTWFFSRAEAEAALKEMEGKRG